MMQASADAGAIQAAQKAYVIADGAKKQAAARFVEARSLNRLPLFQAKTDPATGLSGTLLTSWNTGRFDFLKVMHISTFETRWAGRMAV